MWNKLNQILSNKFFILSFIGLLIILVPYVENKILDSHESFVQFDMKGTTQEFVNGLATQKITAKETQAVVKRFTLAMQKDLQDYSFKHHAVILVSAAVISGLPDITNTIKAELVDQLGSSKK